MAEEQDPFEAAMGQLKQEEEGNSETSADPFEEAIKATQEEDIPPANPFDSGDDDPFDAAMKAAGEDSKGEPAAADPFEAAMKAAGGDSGSEPEDPFEAAMKAAGGDSANEPEDPFEAAMKAAGGDSIGESEDPFEAAMKASATGDSNALAVSNANAPSAQVEEKQQKVSIDFLLDVKLKVSFEVGRSKMLIRDLLSLGQGSVIELHRLVGENLELFVNGQLLASGEVIVVNEKFGARIVEVIPPIERIKRMGQNN